MSPNTGRQTRRPDAVATVVLPIDDPGPQQVGAQFHVGDVYHVVMPITFAINSCRHFCASWYGQICFRQQQEQKYLVRRKFKLLRNGAINARQVHHLKSRTSPTWLFLPLSLFDRTTFPFFGLPTAQSVDEVRTPMVLVLDTETSGQGSLGMNKDLTINTLPPYVLDVASSKRNGKYLS